MLINVTIIAAAALFASLAPCAAAPETTAPGPAPTPASTQAPFGQRLLQSYDLGRLYEEPSIGVLYLDHNLQALADYKNDAAASQAILADGKIAATTRATELTAYQSLGKLVKELGGPDSVQAACRKAVKILEEPVNPATKGANGVDPISENILATLDEADTIKIDASALLAWVKISRGTEGIWAFHLGQLSEGLDDSARLYQPSLYQRSLLTDLKRNIPVDAPASAVGALDDLRKLRGGGAQADATIAASAKAIDAAFGVPSDAPGQ